MCAQKAVPAPANRGETGEGRRSREPASQQRHQADGHDQRAGQGQEVGDGDDLQERSQEARLRFQEDDRQEDHGVGDARGKDGADGPADPLDGGLLGCGAALELALYRLEDDDAVVHQHPDAHRQGKQRDQIDRLSEDVEQGQRRKQADGDRHRHDGDTAPLSKEEEQHRERDHEPGGGELLQPVELILDHLRAVHADDEVDSMGSELLAELLDPDSQGASESHQVGALFVIDDQGHGRPAVHPEQHLLPSRAEVDLRDVAHLHGGPGNDGDLADGDRSPRPAVEDHRRPTPLVLEAAHEGQAPHRARERRDNLLGSDADRSAPIRVDPNGQLL